MSSTDMYVENNLQEIYDQSLKILFEETDINN